MEGHGSDRHGETWHAHDREGGVPGSPGFAGDTEPTKTYYYEKYLLLDEGSSAKAKESGLSIVQREMARQWFGNLVTCSWWDYLWLHDAFAAYFQYFSTDLVYPDWRMNQMFVVERHQQALEYDQTPRRPITTSMQTPEDINNAFYDQTYSKAAAFLRMLKYTTNDTIFQQSLVRYLKQNKYVSVDPDVLFEAFEYTISKYQFNFGEDVTVTNFMKHWTEQAGYPMINVVKVNDEFIITQERCLMDTPDKITDSSRWYIGITYTTESSKNFENFNLATWCKPNMDKCVLSDPQNDGWFIFNVQSTGFYRVNYDTENWSSLVRQLKERPYEIHVLNRAQLIDDSFYLARADKLHYSVPLQISSYLKIEDDVLPWYSAINGYSYLLERMRRNNTEYTDLRVCVSNLAGIIYKKIEDQVVEKKNNDHIILTSWNAFSVWACQLNNEVCIRSAFDYYTKWQNGEKIPTDIRDAAFCVGVHITNDISTWEQMFELYKTTRSPSEKQSAQTAMACTEDESLLSRYLNYTFETEDGPIRNQDYKDVFTAVSSTPIGLNVLIDFLIKQLKDDPKTPENLRKAFNKSYNQVNNNLYWFNKYHEIVNQNTGCSKEFTTTDQPTETSTPKKQSTEPTQLDTTLSGGTDSTTSSGETTVTQYPSTKTEQSTVSTQYDTTLSGSTDSTPIYTQTSSGETTVSQYSSSTAEQSTISTQYDTTLSGGTDSTTPIYTQTSSGETTVSQYPSTKTEQSTISTQYDTTLRQWY
ncbi:aminopeptidase N-like [Melanaphis sacchari]|uniref:aminopeptidase N-like n=1 Tax=Melanaphis sacchari TaxID=742174 RepID=UPI000DC146E7|nr:aminopeptidase N-like [Melanaphis sacchari]